MNSTCRVVGSGAYTSTVISAAGSPARARIVTASWDKTARVREAATGKELARLEGHGDGVGSAAWSPLAVYPLGRARYSAFHVFDLGVCPN
jgi:WD40 repeat protein